jgi:hypothetical protein
MGWARVHPSPSNGDVKVEIPRLRLGMTTKADVIPNKVRDLDLREVAKHGGGHRGISHRWKSDGASEARVR